MPKSRDAFRTISEVAEWLDTPAHVLRFWESKFSQVKPVKRAGGRRYYRPSDMELLGGIKKLLHEDGMTIKGVQKVLREQGVRHVASLAAPGGDGAAEEQDGELIEDAPYSEVPYDEEPPAVVPFPSGPPRSEPAAEADAAHEPDEPRRQEAAADLSARPLADPPEPETETVAEPVAHETPDIAPRPEPAQPVEASAPEETSDAGDSLPNALSEEEEPAAESPEAVIPEPEALDTPAPLEADEDTQGDFEDIRTGKGRDTPEHAAPIEEPQAAEPVEDQEDAASTPRSHPVTLPDFDAPPRPAAPPPGPSPGMGPLGLLARITALSPDAQAAIAAQIPRLQMLRDSRVEPPR